jgi:hypothetical protein
MSVVSDILFRENETTMLSQNKNQLPTDAAAHPRGTETSGPHIHFLMK